MKNWRKVLVSGFVSLMLVFSGVFLVTAQDQEVPDVVEIKPTIWQELKKKPVQLSHKKHSEEYQAACTDCHHDPSSTDNQWKQGDPVKTCEQCHNEPTTSTADGKLEKDLGPEQAKLNLQLAYHNNCKECHKAHKKSNPESKAPTVCAKCHPGENGEKS